MGRGATPSSYRGISPHGSTPSSSRARSRSSDFRQRSQSFSSVGSDEEGLAPVSGRECTDAFCGLLFALYVSGLVALFYYVARQSDTRRIEHGLDHDNNLCGLHSMHDRPYTFYPDLNNDIMRDPSLRQRYGVCVEACPEKGMTISDYGDHMRHPEWFVAFPSFPLFSRCIPYNPPANDSDTLLCANPGCEVATRLPTRPQEVCGLEKDGTDRFWLMSKPDASIMEGWFAEGASNSMVQARFNLAQSASESLDDKSCIVPLRRHVAVSIRPANEQMSLTILGTTGPAFKFGASIFAHKELVCGVGLGGALLVCLVIMSLFPFCAHIVVIVLLLVLFVSLGVANYILYVQAGIAPVSYASTIEGYFQEQVHVGMPSSVESILHQTSHDQTIVEVYKWSSFALSALIVLAVCTFCALMSEFEMLVALLYEASQVLLSIPWLLVFPFLLLVSMALVGVLLGATLLGIVTAEPKEVQPLLEYAASVSGYHALAEGASDDAFRKVQNGSTGVVVFGLLWLYFFHVAVFTAIVAHAVSRWYFQAPQGRTGLKGILGVPVMHSGYTVCRYHLGSLAYGSLLMTLFTLPRLIVEYLVYQAKGSADDNVLARVIVRCARCVTWCMQQCMDMITGYSYVYIAVSGLPFWASAQRSFELFAKYSAQVALDRIMSTLLGYITCITVPAILAVVTFLLVDRNNFLGCALAVVVLAYMTTRIAVGVYDITVTTLLVCVMRDEEFASGSHMTPELRKACKMPPRT